MSPSKLQQAACQDMKQNGKHPCYPSAGKALLLSQIHIVSKSGHRECKRFGARTHQFNHNRQESTRGLLKTDRETPLENWGCCHFIANTKEVSCLCVAWQGLVSEVQAPCGGCSSVALECCQVEDHPRAAARGKHCLHPEVNRRTIIRKCSI